MCCCHWSLYQLGRHTQLLLDCFLLLLFLRLKCLSAGLACVVLSAEHRLTPAHRPFVCVVVFSSP